MRKLRPRQGNKLLIQSHIAGRRPSLNSHQDLPGPQAMFPALCFTVSRSLEHMQDLWGQVWKKGTWVTRQSVAQAIVNEQSQRGKGAVSEGVALLSLCAPTSCCGGPSLFGTSEFVVLGIRLVAASAHSTPITLICAVHWVLPARTPCPLPFKLNGQKQVWD